MANSHLWLCPPPSPHVAAWYTKTKCCKELYTFPTSSMPCVLTRQSVPIPANSQEWQATVNNLINSMWKRCVMAWCKWWSHKKVVGFLSSHHPTPPHPQPPKKCICRHSHVHTSETTQYFFVSTTAQLPFIVSRPSKTCTIIMLFN